MDGQSLYIWKDALDILPTGEYFQFSTDPSQGIDFRNFSCDVTISTPTLPRPAANKFNVLYKVDNLNYLITYLQNMQTNLIFRIGGYMVLDPFTSYCQPKAFITENQPQTVSQVLSELIINTPTTYADGGVTNAGKEQIATLAGAENPFFQTANYWASQPDSANSTIPSQSLVIQRVNMGFLFNGLFKSGFKKYPGKNDSAYHYFILNQFCSMQLKDNFSFKFWVPYVSSCNANGTEAVFGQTQYTLTVNKIRETRAIVSEMCKQLFSNVAILPKYYDQVRQETRVTCAPQSDGWIKLQFSCSPFMEQTYAIRRYTLQGPLQKCLKYTIRLNNIQKDVDGYNFYDGQQFSINNNINYKQITFVPDKDLTPSNQNYLEFYLFFGDNKNLTTNAECIEVFGQGATAIDLLNGAGFLGFQCYSTQEYVVYNNENFQMIAALEAQTQQQIGNRILDYNPENYLQQKQLN